MHSYEYSSSLFIGSFTCYYVVEQCLRYLLARHLHSTAFQIALQNSYKDRVYYGILMGALITILSTPFCISAAIQVNPLDKSFVRPSTLSSSETVCLTSRAVLWVSELNRLDLYFPYVAHHLASIIMMLSTLYFHFFEVLYIPYAALLSEVTGDFIWLLAAHRDHDPRWSHQMEYWRVQLKRLNVWVYLVCRASSWAILPWTIRAAYQRQWESWAPMTRFALVLWAVLVMLAYLYWLVRYIRTQVGGMIHPFILDHPIRVKLPYSFILTLYGPLMGLAFAALVLVSLLLTPASPYTLSRIILSAVLGARLMSLLLEDGLTAFKRSPITVFFRPGFWLHGGIIGAGVGIVNANEHTHELTAAFCIGLPLYEAISRLGCHTYGCCYGFPIEDHTSLFALRWLFSPALYTSPAAAAVRSNPSLRDKHLFPIQKISSLLFFIQFLLNAVLVQKTSLPLYSIGGISLFLHAAIRLWTERYRYDYRGTLSPSSTLSTTGMIALTQMAAAGPLIAMVAETSPHANVAVRDLPVALQVPVLRFVFIVGTLVYGLHRGEVGQGVLGF